MGHRVAVLKDGVLQQCEAPRTLYHEPVNLFVAGFIGSPAMNLVEVGEDRPLRVGDAELELNGPGAAAAGEGAGNMTVGFRPEALKVGDGPLSARIRTVEDLGSEMFVHVAVEHHGDSVPLIAKMTPPFDGGPDDQVRLQITGTTHLFGEDGTRIASAPATLRAAGAVSRS
jgi:multiple sugar transport system ATP-binding protein